MARLPAILASSSVLLAGLLVVLAPWLHRQRIRMRSATDEKLRAEARADMAAHLHDSVLQTLALIQRRADDRIDGDEMAVDHRIARDHPHGIDERRAPGGIVGRAGRRGRL